MKKTISVALTFIFLLFSVSIIASADSVTDMATGMSNVKFSNGYIGFCIDSEKHTTSNGDVFTPAEDTSVATNNQNKENVSQKLKILFTQCFDDIFTSDGNGGYYIEKSTADTTLQSAIYHFTDNYWPSGAVKTLTEKVKSYDGPEIPDDGYQIEKDGKIITFHFAVMEPQKEDQQSFFSYKLEVTDKPAHEHTPSTDWEYDDDNHWHECDCEEKLDLDKHDATTADCKNPSVCTVCGKTLGDVNPENHTGETEIRNAKDATEFEKGYTGDTHCKDCGKLLESGETIPATHQHIPSTDWEYDDENHWHECDCDEKLDLDKHDATTADCKNPSVCTVCGKTLGDVNSENHTGETEIRNAKDATEFEEGYTGDTHCKDCGELLERGETIPATHMHSFGEEWKFDKDNHWHECKCGEKDEVAKHTPSDGKCITCGTEINENEKEPGGGIDLDEILGMLPEIDLDSILGALPEINLDGILGIIPGFGDNSSTPETDKETDTEIPETGSDSSIIFVFITLSVSIITVSAVTLHRKKKISDK